MSSIHLDLDVGGIAVAVEAEDERFVRCAALRLGSVPTTADPELFVHLGSTRPDPPEDASHQVVDGFRGWEADGALWMGVDGARVKVDGPRMSVGGPIDTDAEEDLLDDLLQFGISVAAARPDRIMLHAAVVARDGEALLLVGGSGRGKSTLSAAAILAGWELLGDDLAVVDTEANVVRGVPRAPMVPAEIARTHGLEGDQEAAARGRIQLPFETLTTDARRVIGLVMVDHGDDGHLEDLGTGDLEVMDSGYAVPTFRMAMRRQLAASARLMTLPTLCLHHARDLDHRVSRAQDLLLEAWQHCHDAQP